MVGFAVLINFRPASAQYFFRKNFADIMAFCGVEESWAQQIKCGRKLGTGMKEGGGGINSGSVNDRLLVRQARST